MTKVSAKSDYETYRKWKSWDGEVHIAPWQARYYAKEIERARLSRMQTVLEIGFGNGEFLQWAQGQGATVTGVEIIPELVDVAQAAGLEAYLYNIVEPDGEDPLCGRKFDCIVALDVLEHLQHLTVEQAKVALSRMAGLLEPEGRAHSTCLYRMATTPTKCQSVQSSSSTYASVQD